MSDEQQPRYGKRIVRVIEDYVKPKTHLLAMERIHKRFSGETKNFSSWSEVAEFYSGYNWDKERVEEFTTTCKQVVEGSIDRISETYFLIQHPSEVNAEEIRRELDKNPYQPDANGEAREGFDYEFSEGQITGNYIYVDVNTNLSYSGEIRRLINETVLKFRIDIENQILILESTSVVDVQRMKSVIRTRTSLEISVLFDPTVLDNPTDRFNSFIESFTPQSQDISEESERPSILAITEVRMKNTSDSRGDVESENVESIEYQGDHILQNADVEEKFEQGYIISRVTGKFEYRGEIMSFTIAGGATMSYLKVENIHDRTIASEAMNYLRQGYIDFLGYRG